MYHSRTNGNKHIFRVIRKELNTKQKEWWRDPESNRGHKDFQSSALPTELSRQMKIIDSTKNENDVNKTKF